MLRVNTRAVSRVTHTIALFPYVSIQSSPTECIPSTKHFVLATPGKMQTQQQGKTHISTHIQRLRHPLCRNAPQGSRQPVDVPRRRPAARVDIARQAGPVLRVADEEDTFNGAGLGAGEAGKGVDGSGGPLRVALKDKAFGGIGGEGLLDVVDDLRRR